MHVGHGDISLHVVMVVRRWKVLLSTVPGVGGYIKVRAVSVVWYFMGNGGLFFTLFIVGGRVVVVVVKGWRGGE
jgi:hypothetical protein